MANRTYRIECHGIEKVASNPSLVKSVLHWLYNSIKLLHNEVRE